jgi:hypothetical protein
LSNPQHLVIPLAGGARMEAADQLSHVVATLYGDDLTLRQVEANADNLRGAAHTLLDDLIDHPLPVAPPPGANHPLLSMEELRFLLRLPVTLDGSQLDLGLLRNAADAADALGEIFDGLEEAFTDDYPDPAGPDAKDERRRLRALRLAIDLLKAFSNRGA